MHHISAIGRGRGARRAISALRVRASRARTLTKTLPTLTRSRPSQMPRWHRVFSWRRHPYPSSALAGPTGLPSGALTVTLSTDDLAVPWEQPLARAMPRPGWLILIVSGGESQACKRKDRCAIIDLLTVRSISFRRSDRSLNVIGIGAILGRMLPSENAPAAVGMGEPLLLCDQLLYRRTGGVALNESSLVIEALERCQLFLTSELRVFDRRL
jgi:hypothetical protein